MADEHQFIEDGLQRSQINEFFADELSRAGYGGMQVAKTPMGTQIVLKAEKPGMVIGKGGKNIRKVTRELEERFDLDDPQIDVQEVDEPDLNAQIVADRLANALERGWYFRKAGHTTIDRIMDAGAGGALACREVQPRLHQAQRRARLRGRRRGPGRLRDEARYHRRDGEDHPAGCQTAGRLHDC
jgi:ribosomal protein uS3